MEHYGRRIRVFKNGDPYFTGKKMLISPAYHRLYEQLLHECSRELEVKVKNFYTIDGVKLKGLDDFVDGNCYVCTGGEAFRRIQYNDSETGPNFNAYSKTNLTIPVVKDNPIMERKKVNRSTGGLLSEETTLMKGSEQSLFVATSKAFKIAVFENGEPKQDGMRLILNHRNCKTFDQLMKYFSSLKIIKSGQIRKMYDAKNGKRVRHLSEIENGMNLVLSAFDPFKKVPYKLIDLSASTQVKREPEVLRIVKFFPNGDAYHSGLTVTITKRRHSTMTKLLDQLNSQIELVTGKIQKIYTTDGSRCNTIEEIKGGGNYVLVANDDPFIKTQYNKMALKVSTANRGLQGHTLRNDFIKRIRPITQRRLRRQTALNDNASIAEDASIEAPTRLKTTKSKKEVKLEDEGMETEREEQPAPSRKLASRGKTPTKVQTPPAKVQSPPPVEAPKAEPEPFMPKKEYYGLNPEENRSQESLVDEEPTPVYATQLIREVAGKPKTPVKNTIVPVNAEKKSKPDMSQNADGPEKVKFRNSSGKSKPTTPAAKETNEVPPEDDMVAKSTGREEEELFESEKQKVKVLSANKINSGPSSKPSSKPASRVHTAPNNNPGMVDKDEEAALDRVKSQPSNLASSNPASPPAVKKYNSSSNPISKSSKSISKIPKAVSSRSSSQTNLKPAAADGSNEQATPAV